MNYRMILSLLGDVLLVIGAFLLLPCIVAVIYGEPELWVLLASAAGSGLLGGLFILLRPKRRREVRLGHPEDTARKRLPQDLPTKGQPVR